MLTDGSRKGHTDRPHPVVLVALALCLAYLMAGAWLTVWAAAASLVPGWRPVAITSGSMAPGIAPGDLVIARRVGVAEQLQRPDVIVFHSDGRLLTHRIVSTNPDGSYRTKGDANPSADSTPVVGRDVLGKSTILVPFLGRPLVWLRNGNWRPLGLWAASTLAAVWFVRTWLWWRPQPASWTTTLEAAAGAEEGSSSRRTG